MDWKDQAQDGDQWTPPVKMGMYLQVLGGITGSFSRRAHLHVVSGNRQRLI